MEIRSTRHRAENIRDDAGCRPGVEQTWRKMAISLRPSESISIPNYFKIHLQLSNGKTARSRNLIA